jgi:hypothetical protein
MQFPAAVAFIEVPVTEHPAPVTVKVTAPSPDPPDVTSVIAVPAVPVSVVFDTVSVARKAAEAVNVKVFAALVAAR